MARNFPAQIVPGRGQSTWVQQHRTSCDRLTSHVDPHLEAFDLSMSLQKNPGPTSVPVSQDSNDLPVLEHPNAF
jgi:hypothetical protein